MSFHGLGIGLMQNVAATSGGGGGAWTPASLPGLTTWVEADPTKLYTDAGTTLVSADGQAVQQANDKSGLSHNFSQPTLGQRPLYRTGSGKPYLDFGGSARMFGTGAVDASGQFYIGISCYFNAVAAAQFLADMFQHNSPFSEIAWVRCKAGGTSSITSFDTGVGATDDDGSAISATTPLVMIGTVTTTAAEMFKDNASGGSTALTGTRQSGAADLHMGADSAGANNLAGRIYGIVQGSGTLSSGDRASLQTYLAALHP